MKKALIILVFTIMPIIARANCYQIKDNDMKNNCLALEKGQVSYCYQIRNNDARNYCLAKLKEQKSYCYQIKDADKKNECLTMVR